MPSFLHSDAAALNDLLRPKKRTLSKLKQTFKGSEQAKVDGTTASTEKLFEVFLDKLTKLAASLYEISTTSLTLSTDLRKKPKIADLSDRFIGANSSLVRLVPDVVGFTNRMLKNNLNQFTPSQIDEIATAFQNIQNYSATYNDQFKLFERDMRFDDILEQIDALTQEWEPSLDAWSTTLEQLIENYKQGRPFTSFDDSISESSGFETDSDATGSGYKIRMGQSHYLPHRFL